MSRESVQWRRFAEVDSAAIHQNRAEHEEQQENLQQSLDGFFELLRKHGGKTGEEMKAEGK